MDHRPDIAVSIKRTLKEKKTLTKVNATVLGVVQLDITLASWRFCIEADETAASRATTKNPTVTIVVEESDEHQKVFFRGKSRTFYSA